MNEREELLARFLTGYDFFGPIKGVKIKTPLFACPAQLWENFSATPPPPSSPPPPPSSSSSSLIQSELCFLKLERLPSTEACFRPLHPDLKFRLAITILAQTALPLSIKV